jgi:CRP-like cAMP-binding protein
MGLPARQPQPAAAAPLIDSGPQKRHLKKGELLFAEGENSRAMYLLKQGMIRLYKKKGDSVIELDTVHSGQVLGELAFLDGNPRSASGEALTECDLVEISGPAFQKLLSSLPDWLKILMKTIVQRLRTASTRIRQLETASTAYDYSEKDGKRSAHYVYLSATDVLKVLTGLLLVGSRNGIAVANGTDIRVGLLQRYCNQIMGIPVAKITSLLDVLADAGLVTFGQGDESGKVYLRDADFLEQLITYLNEENLLEPSKRHDLSPRGFLVMSVIAKHLGEYKADEKTGLTLVNLGEIRKQEARPDGREPFRMEEFAEMVKFKYATSPNVKSNSEMYTAVKADVFAHHYRLQRVVLGINAANEQKRKSGGGR